MIAPGIAPRGSSWRAMCCWALVARVLAGCGDDAPDMERTDAAWDAGAAPAPAHDGGHDDGGAIADAGGEDDAAADAGDDGAAGDAGTLRLLARSPEPDAENVDGRAPVVLQFSAALDPATVTPESIRVETAAGPLAGELRLSADRREVRFEPSSVPIEPARVTAIASDTLADQAGRVFAGERWSWTLPLWRRSAELPAVLEDGADVGVALDDRGAVLVAWISGGDGMRALRVARVQDGGFELLAEAALAGGHPSARGHAASIDMDGTVFVSSIEQDSTVLVRALSDSGFEPAFVPFVAQGRVQSADLAVVGGTPRLAVVEQVGAESDARVLRYDADQSSWIALGGALDRVAAQPASQAVLAVNGAGQLAVAWLEHDGVSSNLYVSRWDEDLQAWSPVGAAVDLELDARVADPQLALGADGTMVLLWHEGPAARPAVHVARYRDRWQMLGGGLDSARESAGAALALDARDEPVAVLRTGATAESLSLLQYNGSPEPPFGLGARASVACALPAGDAADFPATLSTTGCFDDVPTRTPAAGLIPYSVNSPLWSDGALKRRFVVIPDGATIGYRERDSWTLPVGTVLIKEFLLQRSADDPSDAQPMETRFLVKRCEPGACRAAWEGYSYQWNDDGTEAVLLDNVAETLFKDFTAGASVHRHSYPGRDECIRCHANAPGGALGLQTGQLNRNHDYGEQADNQIRALAHIGLFGDSLREPSEAELAALWRLPMPYDAAEALDARVRSYTHANCSHCHRPDGRWPVVDLRFDAELRGAADPSPNICNKLVPGDASTSLLYQKVSTRKPDLPAGFQGDPMPPLATLVTDPRIVPTVAGWIDAMQSCP